jgi:hypothetical protein
MQHTYPRPVASAILLVCAALLSMSIAARAAVPRLKVSDNHRFLVHENGQPFFWLGDTAWELFHRLNREEAERYLQNRAEKGYTIIQAVATWFHEEDWLDFNMRQNGHSAEFTGRYDQTRVDYDRTPVKPVLDGEPIYEDHPVSFDPKKLGHSNAADVRRPFYWDTFTGAFGHTYGHHSIWQMWAPNRGPINNPLMPWFEAIDQPGAGQMKHGKNLLLSRPFLTRIPDDSIIVTDRVPTSVPGAGRYRFVATRDEAGSYAMVYAPTGRKFKVRMEVIRGPRVKAWWFNPRDGKARDIGEFANTGEREFIPPDRGETLDWVLVLDDVAAQHAAPGSAN